MLVEAKAERAYANADARAAIIAVTAVIAVAIARFGVIGRPAIIAAVRGAIAAVGIPAMAVAVADDADVLHETVAQHSRSGVAVERHGPGATDCDGAHE